MKSRGCTGRAVVPAPARSGRLLAILALALGCASNPAPRGSVPPAAALQFSTRGGYVAVQRKEGGRLDGELLAAGPEHLVVKTRNGPESVGRPDIHEARLVAYESGEGRILGIGLLGTISTVTHGFLLILTAPVWLLSSSAAALAESKRGKLVYPGTPLAYFAMYARYPQGMPASQATP